MPNISADPYAWPYNSDLRPENTALLIIDMQTDFCGRVADVDSMGYDLNLTRVAIEPIKRVLDLMRQKGYHIFHTREGHRADLTDLPANGGVPSKSALVLGMQALVDASNKR